MFLPWECSCWSSVSISCPFSDATMLCMVNALDHVLGLEVPISFIIFIAYLYTLSIGVDIILFICFYSLF